MVSLKVGYKESMPGTIALNMSASLTERIVPCQVLGAAGALYLVYNKRHRKRQETGPLLQLMQVPCLLKYIKTSIEVVGRVKMSKIQEVAEFCFAAFPVTSGAICIKGSNALAHPCTTTWLLCPALETAPVLRQFPQTSTPEARLPMNAPYNVPPRD